MNIILEWRENGHSDVANHTVVSNDEDDVRHEEVMLSHRRPFFFCDDVVIS
jgi:hypothetical protein